MRTLCVVACLTLSALAFGAVSASLQDRVFQLQPLVAHDNVTPAGRVEKGERVVSLYAAEGLWRPEGDHGPSRRVAAFGEEGGPISIPSPFIRVAAGTTVRIAVRNTLEQPLVVHGFCDRPAKTCEPLRIPPGQARERRFTLKVAGTFHYWAATGAESIEMRTAHESQLGGAIVVDADRAALPERVFVMTMIEQGPADARQEVVAFNGRSWPATERLTYSVGDTARWRVINLTAVPHAMHLHGFYYTVESLGDGWNDTVSAGPRRPLVVTQQLPPGRTMSMSWVPERAGNWLFHCHMLMHMMSPESVHHGGIPTSHELDASAGMAGLVLGIHVSDRNEAASRQAVRPTPGENATPRRLQLIVSSDTRHGATPSYKVDLDTGTAPAPRLSDRAVPGPVMLLTRGEPVAVDVVNRLNEPTAIHWHGIELESYHDGVAGFGGMPGSVTPAVAPGATFTARFTPPRAGTFIYHTHWHNAGQLAAGIYGPLIVLEPGQRFDPSTDHVVVLGLDGAYTPLRREPFVVNGEPIPGALVLKAGVTNRLRVINITPDNVALTVQLLSGLDPVQWTVVGKDGADLPQPMRTPRPARQLVSVGETYDVELAPMSPRPLGLWMELRRGNGELIFQWAVRVQ